MQNERKIHNLTKDQRDKWTIKEEKKKKITTTTHTTSIQKTQGN